MKWHIECVITNSASNNKLERAIEAMIALGVDEYKVIPMGDPAANGKKGGKTIDVTILAFMKSLGKGAPATSSVISDFAEKHGFSRTSAYAGISTLIRAKLMKKVAYRTYTLTGAK